MYIVHSHAFVSAVRTVVSTARLACGVAVRSPLARLSLLRAGRAHVRAPGVRAWITLETVSVRLEGFYATPHVHALYGLRARESAAESVYSI